MTTKYLAVSLVFFPKKSNFIHKIGEFLLEKAVVTLRKHVSQVLSCNIMEILRKFSPQKNK
jgi:hypothetical protein